MSQIDEEFEVLDALLEKPEPQLEDHVEDDAADAADLADNATASTRGLLSEVDGDAAEDFEESLGVKRDRSVPDRSEPWMKHHQFTLVTSVARVNEIVDECIRRGSCSLDLECEGLDNRIQYREDGSPETVHKIVGFCISYDGLEGFYIPVRHKPTDGGPDLNVRPVVEVEAAISRLCHAAIPEGTPEDIAVDPFSYKCPTPKVVIYFWNAQFDHEFLYPITGIDWWHPASFEDGILACFCIHAGDKRLGLKLKAQDLLRDPDGNPYKMIELKELFFGRRKDIRFAILAPDDLGVLRYGGSDAICTYLLCKLDAIVPTCLRLHANTYRIEKQTSNALRVMERARVRINREHIKALLLENETKKVELLKKIQSFALEARGIELDPNSPKQLSEFLFGPKPGGLDISPKPEKNAASGQYKTDGDTLEGLAEASNAPAILKDIVRYREVEKFIGTYLVGLAHNADSNDDIRVSFKQTGAASGRLSAPAGKADHGYAGIPIHGIPQESDIRRDFIARPGYTLVKADFAGEELRIAANVTGEKVWVDEFLHGTGDLHSITARAFFGRQDITKEERSAGKIANFSLLYGGGPKAIIRATGCDEMEARRRKQAFDKAVPTFAAWIKQQHKLVKKNKGVHTAFGRWLSLPDAEHPDAAVRAAVERHAVNYQIQGAGADIMKICLIMLTKKFQRLKWLKNGGDDSVRMLLTVHDEVVFEVRHDRVAEAIPLIVDTMEHPWKLPNKPKWTVPLVVEPLLGFNWKSGFAAERATKDRHIKASEIDRTEEEIPLRRYEVLMNGFVYSTTREPKRDKKTRQIVETLDQQEVLEGEVFRIVDPPWLVGRSLPPAPPAPSNPEPEVISGSAPTDPRPEASGSSRVQGTLELVSPSAPRPGVLRLRIQQLTMHSADQVCSAIINASDNDDGADLHLTDVTGHSLLGPGRVRVREKPFIAELRYMNLLCEYDLDGPQPTT